MNKTEEKIKQLAAQTPASSWKEKVAYRKENKVWLRKATRVSLRVLDALDEKGWSQAQLARALEVTPQQVTKIVKGENDFKLSTISKLEAVLGIQLQVILAPGKQVITEEEIRARVQEEIGEYHQRWAHTQQYLSLKYQKTDPQLVMAVEPASGDEFAMAG